MELRAHFFHRQDTDLIRQQRIRSAQYGIGVHRSNRFDVSDLSMRMHAGIGSARTGDVHVMIEEFLKRLLKFALNGSQFRLNLPSMEVGAVICEGQLEVPHPIGYSMCAGGWANARDYSNDHYFQ